MKKLTALYYEECVKVVEEELGYDIRDTLGSCHHYDKWCRLVKEKPDGSSQEQYKRYRRHPKGEALCPEYRDWWHFLCDNLSLSNDSIISIGSNLLDVGTSWQNDITATFIKLFGDNTQYYVSW